MASGRNSAPEACPELGRSLGCLALSCGSFPSVVFAAGKHGYLFVKRLRAIMKWPISCDNGGVEALGNRQVHAIYKRVLNLQGKLDGVVEDIHFGYKRNGAVSQVGLPAVALCPGFRRRSFPVAHTACQGGQHFETD